jgi:zeaxanthin glucosyltransferase
VTFLVISPDYASHYEPMAVLAREAAHDGWRVVVATGPALRARVEGDGFEWRMLRLGASSNTGVVAHDPAIERFLGATRRGALDTIRHQAEQREVDLLWEPERVARSIGELVADLEPDAVLVVTCRSVRRWACTRPGCRSSRSCPATPANCRSVPSATASLLTGRHVSSPIPAGSTSWSWSSTG